VSSDVGEKGKEQAPQHDRGRRFTLDEMPAGDEAPAGVSGQTRLVLIGQNLDARHLRAQLAACVVPGVVPAGP
jgi:hypothetical protein